MKKKIIPTIAMLLVAAVNIGLCYAANPVPTYHVTDYGTPVVMTINGDEIHANEYAAYYQANKASMENQYAMFGLDTSEMWTDPSTSEMMLSSLQDATEQMLLQYHVIAQQFDEAGLKLTLNDARELRQYKQQLIEQYGGEETFEHALKAQGLTDEMFDNSMTISKYVEKLNTHYFGEGGVYTVSDDELIQVFNDTYVQAKHILIATQDTNTFEKLTGDALEEKKALAKEALERAKAGEDFDALIAEYGEDPGMASNPDGYIFKDGDMVPEFYEGTLALQEGEISDIIESDYGYHIIMRMPLDAAAHLDDLDLAQEGTYRNLLNAQITGKDFTTLIQDGMNNADVQKVDEELAKIDVNTAYDIAMTGTNLPASAAEETTQTTDDDAAVSEATEDTEETTEEEPAA